MKELETHLGAGNVEMEKFTAAPDAFLGSFPLSALLLLTALLFHLSVNYLKGISGWIAALAALLFSILSALPFIFEYIKYDEFIDPLFKKKQSANVIGMLHKPGNQNVKNLLLISGHHDSALENTWISLLGYGFFTTLPVLVIGFITMVAMSLLQIAGKITGSVNILRAGTIGWVPLAFPIIPAIIIALFFNRGRKNGGTCLVQQITWQRAQLWYLFAGSLCKTQASFLRIRKYGL